MKIALGLSGGVDSAVAAYLLKKRGHDIFGLTMRIFDGQSAENEAAEIASHLGIQHTVIDLRKEYIEHVITYLREEYGAGRTPNPCAVCNREIKFGLFLKKAIERIGEFDYFATGHYAELCKIGEDTSVRLNADDEKDQTYFLCRLNKEHFSKIMFPLAGLKKSEVRAIAVEAGFDFKEKKESQDLCAGNYKKYLRPSKKPGAIVLSNGEIIGEHQGIELFTIGQRRGLNVAANYPLYVTAIRQDVSEIVAGPEEELYCASLLAGKMNWIIGDVPDPEKTYLIKIRYRDKGSLGRIKKVGANDSWEICFETPRRAITPGQLAVCYDNNALAGSFFIGFPLSK